MNRSPLTRQRSPWHPVDVGTMAMPGTTVAMRNVHDGSLTVLVADEPSGWHLSISHKKPNGMPGRYPTWDEIAQARDTFLPSEVGFVMHLPAAGEYVAVHPTCFHLHEHPERTR